MHNYLSNHIYSLVTFVKLFAGFKNVSQFQSLEFSFQSKQLPLNLLQDIKSNTGTNSYYPLSVFFIHPKRVKIDGEGEMV